VLGRGRMAYARPVATDEERDDADQEGEGTQAVEEDGEGEYG